MSPTQTITTYVPSVRGDGMLLTHGRKGAAEDLLLASAAVLLDGALGGHIEITGRKFLGFERRRVVAGPEVPGAPLLMADLRSFGCFARPPTTPGAGSTAPRPSPSTAARPNSTPVASPPRCGSRAPVAYSATRP